MLLVPEGCCLGTPPRPQGHMLAQAGLHSCHQMLLSVSESEKKWPDFSSVIQKLHLFFQISENHLNWSPSQTIV